MKNYLLVITGTLLLAQAVFASDLKTLQASSINCQSQVTTNGQINVSCQSRQDFGFERVAQSLQQKEEEICYPKNVEQRSEMNCNGYLGHIECGAEIRCTQFSNDVVCNKVGTSYEIRCCENSGACWIE
jgi:hypothetical protein